MTCLTVKSATRLLLPQAGSDRRVCISGQSGVKTTSGDPTGRSGYKTLTTTSCSRFLFSHNILCPPKVIHRFSTPLWIKCGKKHVKSQELVPNVESCKLPEFGVWNFLKRKQLRVKKLASCRRTTSLRNTVKCSCRSVNHKQYTPPVRARAYSAVPNGHTHMVTRGHSHTRMVTYSR